MYKPNPTFPLALSGLLGQSAGLTGLGLLNIPYYGPYYPYYGPRKWIAVRPRFEEFHRNMLLTPRQIHDRFIKRSGVVGRLNRSELADASASGDQTKAVDTRITNESPR